MGGGEKATITEYRKSIDALQAVTKRKYMSSFSLMGFLCDTPLGNVEVQMRMTCGVYVISTLERMDRIVWYVDDFRWQTGIIRIVDASSDLW